MIIGLRLDADALAAVSNASTVLMIFLFISGGMELGGGLLVAAGKPTATRQQMAELLYNLLFVDLVLALGLTALGFFTLPALLRFIRTPEEILAEAVLYGRVYLVGLPFLMLYDLTKQCVMGCGDSKTPLRAVVATSVMNILLDLASWGPSGWPVPPGPRPLRRSPGRCTCWPTCAKPSWTHPSAGKCSSKIRQGDLPAFRPELPPASQRHHHHHGQAGAAGRLAWPPSQAFPARASFPA